MSRKSKPSFDLADEPAQPDSGGWAYRDDQPAASAPAAAEREDEGSPGLQAGPLITIPLGMMAVGFGVMGQFVFGVARLMAAPIRLFLTR